MRVLVVGTLPEAMEHTSEVLRDAGHDVVSCHDLGDRPFPCRGLRGEPCPLDGDGVDVVVTARDRAWPSPSPYEDGAACALRHHVPMVVHGFTSVHPYDAWARAESRDDSELAALVETVARAPLTEHSDLARATARQVLDAAGLPSDGVDAVVTRRHARLRVMVTLPPGTEAAESSVSAKVLGALRRLDPDARGIDLGFTPAR
ncbi:MAG TPA: hypothetical protein VFC99_14655 [Acidimicrobiia bacterium]|nr:hypothetical protein [Acidimicrobiia bacterium]